MMKENDVEIWLDGKMFSNVRLCGQGLANTAIAATTEARDQIVWRFRKKHKERFVDDEFDASDLNNFITNSIGFLDIACFICYPQVVSFSWSALKKIFACHPDLLPPSLKEGNVGRFQALQMPNLNDLKLDKGLRRIGSVISVELKPKQAWADQIIRHPETGYKSPFCRNCLLQLLKVNNNDYAEMYGFCPLMLFDTKKHGLAVKEALSELLKDPHHNLSINIDGRPVFSDVDHLPIRELIHLLFPRQDADSLDFINLLYSMLTDREVGSKKAFNRNYCPKLRSSPKSVLSLLEEAHKLDTIGILGARDLWRKLPEQLRSELDRNPYVLFSTNEDANLAQKYPRYAKKLETLRAYQMAASVRDCSIMVTFQEVDPDHLPSEEMDPEPRSYSWTPLEPSVSGSSQNELEYKILNRADERFVSGNSVGTIRFKNGGRKTPHSWKAFAYNVRLIDFDLKPMRKIEGNADRILEALEFVEANWNTPIIKNKQGCISFKQEFASD